MLTQTGTFAQHTRNQGSKHETAIKCPDFFFVKLHIEQSRYKYRNVFYKPRLQFGPWFKLLLLWGAYYFPRLTTIAILTWISRKWQRKNVLVATVMLTTVIWCLKKANTVKLFRVTLTFQKVR